MTYFVSLILIRFEKETRSETFFTFVSEINIQKGSGMDFLYLP